MCSRGLCYVFSLRVCGCVRVRAVPGPNGGGAGMRGTECGVEWPEFKSYLFPAVPTGAGLESSLFGHLRVSLSQRLMPRIRGGDACTPSTALGTRQGSGRDNCSDDGFIKPAKSHLWFRGGRRAEGMPASGSLTGLSQAEDMRDPGRPRWLSIQISIPAQIMISGSRVRAPHQVPCSVGSRPETLSLPLSLLPPPTSALCPQ